MIRFFLEALNLEYLNKPEILLSSEESRLLTIAQRDGDMFLESSDYAVSFAIPLQNPLSDSLLQEARKTLLKGIVSRAFPVGSKLEPFKNGLDIEALVNDWGAHISLESLPKLFKDLESLTESPAFAKMDVGHQQLQLKAYVIVFDAREVALHFQRETGGFLYSDPAGDMALVLDKMKEGKLTLRQSGKQLDGSAALPGQGAVDRGLGGKFLSLSVDQGEIVVPSDFLRAATVFHEALHAADFFQGRQLSVMDREKHGNLTEAVYCVYLQQDLDDYLPDNIDGFKRASTHKNEPLLRQHQGVINQTSSSYSKDVVSRLRYIDAFLQAEIIQSVNRTSEKESAYQFALAYLDGGDTKIPEKAFEENYAQLRVGYDYYTGYQQAQDNLARLLNFVSAQPNPSITQLTDNLEKWRDSGDLRQRYDSQHLYADYVFLKAIDLYLFVIDNPNKSAGEKYVRDIFLPALAQGLEDPLHR